MQVIRYYDSPLGQLALAAEDDALVGVWFEGQAHYGSTLAPDAAPGDCAALRQTVRWLDTYFAGEIPGGEPPLHLTGTPFQRTVWQTLRAIPYGQTISYGALAREVAALTGKRPCARAVGAAVGRNPVSLIVPCHRVVGADGRLTGYAGGLRRKEYLLELERADLRPESRTATQIRDYD